MTRTIINIEATAYVDVEIADDAPSDVLTRMQDPEHYEGLYGFMNEDQVLDHWVFNCIANGVEDVSRLDGWGDLDRGMVRVVVGNVVF